MHKVTGNTSVVSALNAVLRIERTAHEGVHDQEHAFERKGYDGLGDWFNNRVTDARTKRRAVLDRLFELDSMPGQDSDPYPVSFEPVDAFTNYQTHCQAALTAYISAVQTAAAASDFPTEIILRKNLKLTAKLLAKTEAKLAELSKLGPELFLAQYL